MNVAVMEFEFEEEGVERYRVLGLRSGSAIRRGVILDWSVIALEAV